MRAASLSQPWCWAVVDELVRKHIENRTWMPSIAMIGETIAIHAAKSWDDAKKYLFRDAVRIGHPEPLKPFLLTPIGYLINYGYEPPARRELYVTSAIVGVATIDRVVTKPDTLAEDQKKWFFGPFGWVLTNVCKLPTPIPCGGKQGLWNVPAELESGIWAQLPRAA